ncbi:cardiolipin synthase [Eubacterium sp.]|uniref:cardiolipin synthase n=1 Tax=Eubacterium sp. TaxID=142586 RepID=UPI0025D28256|nr:cardiolipin synthase [Eubacterium sp.]
MRMKRGKESFFRVIFSRSVTLIAMLFLQIFLILVFSSFINTSILTVYGITNIFSVFLVIYIYNLDELPDFKMAWIYPMMVLPIFGVLLYVFMTTQSGSRVINRKINYIVKKTEDKLVQNPELFKEIEERDRLFATNVNYLSKHAKYPTYDNSVVTYFRCGEELLPDLLEDLKKAKEFIFLEYFIVSEGFMWDQMLEILTKKVEEGVEVRIMYDGLCSLFYLPYGYPKFLRELGIKTKIFAPLKPLLTTQQNNRDHRKIIVIDGKVAYTGGINMADEYINRKKRFGYWKDNGIRIKGDAVSSFTHMFLQLWNLDEKEIDNFDYYCKKHSNELQIKNSYVCGYTDSPLDKEYVGANVYINLINSATNYIYIMTPYLVLDYVMERAIRNAAQRGVKVVILMPGIPDKKYAYCLARTYYPKLINAGVKIYEYTPGFVHSKMIICDDKEFIVGSINFDYRSLYLSFECAALVYGSDEIYKCKDDFEYSIEKSHLVTKEECKNRKLYYKILGAFLKLLAPLM